VLFNYFDGAGTRSMLFNNDHKL